MNISITSICTASTDEWDLIWQKCDYATYFHSREWAEIWNVYSKGKICPEPELVLFSDGKKALLPFSFHIRFKKLIKVYYSSPGGTFGGWISQDELDINYANLLVNLLNNKNANFIWRINPYDPLISKVLATVKSEYDETHALNLIDGFPAIYKQWSRGNKSSTKKAIKEGVSVKTADTLNDWFNYYQVYQDSLKRWADQASSRYEWELFKEIHQRPSSNIKLWLAIYQNQVVSGALCFYAKSHVVYWHGATLKEFFHLRPANLVLCEAIKDACERGYSWFDFNPSGGHEGVKVFKKSFGAQALACPVLSHESSLFRIMKLQGSIMKKLQGSK